MQELRALKVDAVKYSPAKVHAEFLEKYGVIFYLYSLIVFVNLKALMCPMNGKRVNVLDDKYGIIN